MAKEFQPTEHLRKALAEFLANPRSGDSKINRAVYSGPVPSIMHFAVMTGTGEYIYVSPGTVKYSMQVFFQTKNTDLVDAYNEHTKGTKAEVPKNIDWVRLAYPQSYSTLQIQLAQAIETGDQQTALMGFDGFKFMSMVLPLSTELITSIPRFLDQTIDLQLIQRSVSENIVIWIMQRVNNYVTQESLAQHITKDPCSQLTTFVELQSSRN
jgi:hypothetical protein